MAKGNPNPSPATRLTTAGPGRPKGSKNKLTRERVEEELRIIGLMNAGQLFAGGKKRYTLREIADMPEDMQRCIASVKVRTENLTAGDGSQDQTVEIRLWPKVQALELCARSLGMLKDHVVIEDLDARKSRLRSALTRREPTE